jgi:Lar family restriction alleviation protein
MENLNRAGGIGMSELKPCPFCGGTNIETEQGSTFRWEVAYCIDCDAHAGEVRKDTLNDDVDVAEQQAALDAVAEWNRRSSPWISVKDDLPLDGQWAVFGRKDIKHKELLQWQTWFARDHNVTKTGVIIISGLACTHWMAIPEVNNV